MNGLHYYLGVLLLCMSASSSAATCSCAGPPLLGGISVANPDRAGVLLNLSYQYHDIGDLVAKGELIPDETDRDRTAQSLVFGAAYGINDRWSISALTSYVGHSRQVGRGDRSASDGLGNSAFLVQFTPLRIRPFQRNAFSIAIGAGLPTGKDNDTETVTLSEDMQPSTGAWSGLFAIAAEHALNQAASNRLNASLSYVANGTNDRRYAFGNEWLANVGASHRFQTPWSVTGTLHYRQAKRHTRNNNPIPNTGGRWLDFSSALNYSLTEQVTATVSGRLPLWRELNDSLQFTTSYSVTVGITYYHTRQR